MYRQRTRPSRASASGSDYYLSGNAASAWRISRCLRRRATAAAASVMPHTLMHHLWRRCVARRRRRRRRTHIIRPGRPLILPDEPARQAARDCSTRPTQPAGLEQKGSTTAAAATAAAQFPLHVPSEPPPTATPTPRAVTLWAVTGAESGLFGAPGGGGER